MKKVGAVANAFLEKSESISILKLLKLCYIAQGFSLSILNKPIFDDDNIEAWKYGPVIPSLYHEFKHLKGENIGNRRSVFTYLDNNFDFIAEIPELDQEDEKKIIDIVWNMYGTYTAGELVDMTHKRGTPWDMIYVTGMNNIIPNHLIKEYYDILVDKMMRND